MLTYVYRLATTGGSGLVRGPESTTIWPPRVATQGVGQLLFVKPNLAINLKLKAHIGMYHNEAKAMHKLEDQLQSVST